MQLWKTRTLDELRNAKFESEEDEYKNVAYVSYEEAILLFRNGAVVEGRGERPNNQLTQVYSFEGKTYFWVAGYGSGSREDDYPVSLPRSVVLT